MLCTLSEALGILAPQNKALAAFNVFSYQDAAAVIAAAEELDQPVALMANKLAVSHMPVSVIGALFCQMAKEAKVPTVVHLDHAYDEELIVRAMRAGFTSVMFDGSQLPVEENIARSSMLRSLAHACGVSIETEIGSVGYADGTPVPAKTTTPEAAVAFESAVSPDALAISVGTVHRMTEGTAAIDYNQMDKVAAALNTPIVIHGATGVSDEDLGKLVKHGARKINIGTGLRVEFGRVLRKEMMANPDEWCRIKFYGPVMEAIQAMARAKMVAMNGS